MPEGGARHVIGHERSSDAASCRGHRSRKGFLRPAGPAVPRDERRGQSHVPAQRRHDADAAPREAGTQNPSTALTWEVDDVTAEVADLEGRGIVFEDYDLPDFKTVDHVAEMGGDRAAWFKDPDGNVLCVHQVVGRLGSAAAQRPRMS